MTGDTTRTPEPPRPRRWPKLLLAASLTLNVLVLSVIAGAHVREGRDMRNSPPPDRAMLREGGFMPFFDALPREARKTMADALREAGHGKGPDRAELTADFRALTAALRAEPFDPAALTGVLAAQNARVQARIESGRAILVDQIAAMNAKQRAAFADALEQRFPNAMSRAPGNPNGGRGGGH